jgi:hypothetical protein
MKIRRVKSIEAARKAGVAVKVVHVEPKADLL